jgi:mRNA-degrading endonuclease RelE of RelBE toxin-antitoxin system
MYRIFLIIILEEIGIRHSAKLALNLKKSVQLISKNCLIGQKTDIENIRSYLSGNYRLYYEIRSKEIEILLVWDTHRNQEELKKLLKNE